MLVVTRDLASSEPVAGHPARLIRRAYICAKVIAHATGPDPFPAGLR